MVAMESSDHQQPRLIHFCKVCNKGFACGGALGGHMRAHGIEDVNINARNNNNNNEEQQSIMSHKRTYFLRTSTNGFMSHRTAEGGSGGGSCSSFLTWSSLFEQHGSMRRRCASREEEDLANCLVMLSNGKASRVVDDKSLIKKLGSNIYNGDKEEDDHEDKTKEMVVKGMFQCKACKKVFNSHQALGGHRASHKKVKGCFAARFDSLMDDDDDDHDQTVVVAREDHGDQDQEYCRSSLRINPNPSSETHNHLKRKLKVHECSICHRTFSSGQALGGHKRCHWLASNMPSSSDQITRSYSVPKFYGFGYDAQHLFKKPMIQKSGPLDLNLPVSIDDEPVEDDDDDDDVPSKFEALLRIYLPEKEDQQHKNRTHVSLHDVNSEKQCKVKQLAKLGDLRNLNFDGECSRTWLQVGISPTVDGS